MKILKWVGSGSEAHQWIDNGEVKVNHATETQRRKKLRVGDVIEFNGKIAKIK
jgi:ribosome-associated protein